MFVQTRPDFPVSLSVIPVSLSFSLQASTRYGTMILQLYCTRRQSDTETMVMLQRGQLVLALLASVELLCIHADFTNPLCGVNCSSPDPWIQQVGNVTHSQYLLRRIFSSGALISEGRVGIL